LKATSEEQVSCQCHSFSKTTIHRDIAGCSAAEPSSFAIRLEQLRRPRDVDDAVRFIEIDLGSERC
jgi:hypothetical protein